MNGREALERLLSKLQDDRHGYDEIDAETAYRAAIGRVRSAIESVLGDTAPGVKEVPRG